MPGGRPAIKFDMEHVKLLGQFRATFQTMADWFKCDYETIANRMRDETSEFFVTYKNSLSETKMKLSEAQLKFALEGSAALLIWLGKQLLDQRDPDKAIQPLAEAGLANSIDKKLKGLGKSDLRKLAYNQVKQTVIGQN